MTSIHAILIVIIRLWAAGSIIGALVAIPLYATFFFNEEEYKDPYVYTAVGQYIAWFIVGVLAWFTAPWLSRLVYPDTRENEVHINANAETLVAIGGFLIGGFYLVKYGPQLIVDLGWWFAYLAEENPADESQLGGRSRRYVLEWRSTISNLLIVAVAAWMALRPSYLARIFNWLRHAGQYAEENQTEPAHSRAGGNPVQE